MSFLNPLQYADSVIVLKKDTCNFIFQFKELIEVKNKYMHT